MSPFLYPPAPHVRRHGPAGYLTRESFRTWLRDEFIFRCVYCLRREQWDRAMSLQVEHFLPTSQFPSQELEYDNLLYACARCNAAKSNQLMPDPCQVLVAAAVAVRADGRLEAKDRESRRLVSALRLNNPEMMHFRRLWLEIIAMAKRANPQLHAQLLGFPDDLPNLAVLRPPGGNSRPDGIEASHWNLRQRGELPESY